LVFDPEILRQRYAVERDKRIRAEGLDQYRHLSAALPELNVDPFTKTRLRHYLEDAVSTSDLDLQPCRNA
jgi:hypothetical protein